MKSGGNDSPPRVYYGDNLYYAIWADSVDCDEADKYNGFINSTELLHWIGLAEFTGLVTRDGLIKYECRDGHLSLAN